MHGEGGLAFAMMMRGHNTIYWRSWQLGSCGCAVVVTVCVVGGGDWDFSATARPLFPPYEYLLLNQAHLQIIKPTRLLPPPPPPPTTTKAATMTSLSLSPPDNSNSTGAAPQHDSILALAALSLDVMSGIGELVKSYQPDFADEHEYDFG
jgi:hypothetical protein